MDKQNVVYIYNGVLKYNGVLFSPKNNEILINAIHLGETCRHDTEGSQPDTK